MKRIIPFTLLAVALFFATSLFAQAPELINYQGIARNGTGQPLANQAIGLRLTIGDGTTDLYQETQAVTTNAYGLYNVKIGSGTVVSGSMNSVNWLEGNRELKVELDPAGGTTYTQVGTSSQLVSVPYALGAGAVQATSNGGKGLVGTSASNLWWGFYEGGNYRGYLGSYSGKNEDVDLGTGASNTVGSLNFTIAAVPKVTIDSIGRVGVGTRFPDYRFQVDGVTGSFHDNGIRINNTDANTGWSFYSASSGNLIIGRTSNLGQFDGTTGAYSTLSDERLKTNIRPLESVLPKLMALDAKRYEFKNNNPANKTSIGFIAQQLQKLYPEYVTQHTTNDGNPAVQNQLGVDYAGLSVLAIKAIQEQQATIQKLEQKLAELEQRLNSSNK